MKRYQSSSFTYVILTEVIKIFSDNMRIDRSQTRMIIIKCCSDTKINLRRFCIDPGVEDVEELVHDFPDKIAKRIFRYMNEHL